MRSHMKGLSWAGEFDIGDIEVFNGNTIVIMKAPQQFRHEAKLVKAAEKDFVTVANKVLSKISSPGFFIPYFEQFNDLLRNMWRYASFWSDHRLAESMRDFVGHHPFLKPPVAVASLLSGIYNSSRAYDKGDTTVKFLKFMTVGIQGGSKGGWTRLISLSGNPMLVDRFNYKEKSMKRRGQIQNPHAIHNTVVDSEDYDQFLEQGRYEDTLQSFVEYIRHLFNHGTDRTKEKRTLLANSDGSLFDPNPKPREQYMVSIEETEVAVSIHVGYHVCEVLYILAKADSFKGILAPYWDAYKNCCFRRKGPPHHASSQPPEVTAVRRAVFYQIEGDRDGESSAAVDGFCA
ncbi:hypothetical protein BS78_05G124200 [Paspalum vaginatum]|nr:hypothetical protein BS78_05G124200 [Paspalum vaginatum]